MVIQIRRVVAPVSDAEILRIAQTAASAFEGDVFIMPATGGDPALNVVYHQAVVIALLMEGELFVAEDSDESGSIMGVAGYFPPGASLFGGESQEAVFKPYMDQCPLGVREWWNGFIAQYTRLVGDPPEDLAQAYHLQLLATARDYQSRGVGSALIRDGLSRFSQGGALYLETQTESNVGFYKKLGFLVVGREDFSGLEGGEGFPFYSMVARLSAD